jgi:hypothetical protein
LVASGESFDMAAVMCYVEFDMCYQVIVQFRSSVAECES